MVINTEPIRQVIEIDVDKNSATKSLDFARDTGKKIDKELQRKLQIDILQAESKIDIIKKQIADAKKAGEQPFALQLDLKNLQSGLTESKRELRNLENTWAATTSRLSELFKSVRTSITWAFAGIWAALAASFSFDAIIQFVNTIDNASKKLWVLTGATGQELKDLQKIVDNVLPTVDDNITQVSEAVGVLATRFKELSNAQIQEVAPAFLDFIDFLWLSSSAIGDVAEILQEFNIEQARSWDVLDVLLKATQETWVSFQSLAQSLINSGTQLQNLWFNFTESVALLSQLQTSWVNTEAVIKGLNRAFTQLASDWKEPIAVISDLFERIKNAKDPIEWTRIATELFGDKIATELVWAIQTGKLNIEQLNDILLNSQWALAATAKETETTAEKFSKLWNSIVVGLRPVLSALADFSIFVIDLLRVVFRAFQFAFVDITKIWIAFGKDLISNFGSIFKNLETLVISSLANIGARFKNLTADIFWWEKIKVPKIEFGGFTGTKNTVAQVKSSFDDLANTLNSPLLKKWLNAIWVGGSAIDNAAADFTTLWNAAWDAAKTIQDIWNDTDWLDSKLPKWAAKSKDALTELEKEQQKVIAEQQKIRDEFGKSINTDNIKEATDALTNTSSYEDAIEQIGILTTELDNAWFAGQELWNELFKALDGAEEKSKTTIDAITKSIADLNTQLDNLGKGKDEKLADRLAAIAEETAKLQEQQNAGTIDTAGQQKLVDLANERAEAFAGLNESQIAALDELVAKQLEYNALTEVWKILADYELEKAALNDKLLLKQAELEKEQDRLLVFDKFKELLAQQQAAIQDNFAFEVGIADALIAKRNAVARARAAAGVAGGWVGGGNATTNNTNSNSVNNNNNQIIVNVNWPSAWQVVDAINNNIT